MKKMRSLERIFMFILLASIVVFAGCRKTDLVDRSKVTIIGNTIAENDLNQTYEVSGGDYNGPVYVDCPGGIYETVLIFELTPVSIITVRMMMRSDAEPVPEGTYSVTGADCEAGITAFFTAPSLKKAVYLLPFTSGTMKVENDEGTYDINFNLAISPEAGGGKLTGNYTGTLEPGFTW